MRKKILTESDHTGAHLKLTISWPMESLAHSLVDARITVKSLEGSGQERKLEDAKRDSVRLYKELMEAIYKTNSHLDHYITRAPSNDINWKQVLDVQGAVNDTLNVLLTKIAKEKQVTDPAIFNAILLDSTIRR